MHVPENVSKLEWKMHVLADEVTPTELDYDGIAFMGVTYARRWTLNKRFLLPVNS